MFASSVDKTLQSISDVFRHIAHSFLSARSLTALFVSLAVAMLIGRLIAALLRKLVSIISARADKTENLNTVNRLRRYETVIVLSIASIRTFLLLAALYFWWLYVHPGGQPSAIIGASAVLAVVLGSTLSPVLRDIAAGSVMMAEHWYGVGDHVRIEPFGDVQGVVERVSLRSTRLRGLNGEIMWVNNQSIMGVRITPKGIRTLAVELFVNDETGGEELIEKANERLPTGPLLVVSRLITVSSTLVGTKLWHITAVAETAPGREWLIERHAVEVLKEIDQASKKPVLVTDPVARFADSEAEKRFSRTIRNARKRPAPKKRRAGRTSKTPKA